jgi:chromosomal replication initiator protein
VPDSARPDLHALWSDVRDDLVAALPPSTFELWLEAIRPRELRDGTLVLEAPSASRAWVARRYGGLIERLARERVGAVEEVVIAEPTRRTPTLESSGGSLAPNPLHTFNRFVIGPGNRLAHAAALAVAELPGEAYNPLFLHGPPGLGKTHLLGAIAAYLEGVRPDLSVHCTTAERFTTEFVTCLRDDGPAAFKRRHRDVDALLIDDVQALEGKPATEAEFVDTFNALHRAGKQIVLSSDRPPEALEHLAERLRDRFHWGLTVELQSPDIRTRLALLWRMTTAIPLPLDEPTALAAIASTVPENMRRLEGAMTRVAALGSVLSEPLTHDLVNRALGPGKPQEETSRAPGPISIPAIQQAVAGATNVPLDHLLSTSRAPRVSRARQIAMYLTRDLTTASLATIAGTFKRDHTTVRHAIRAVEGRLEPGSETSATISRAREILGTGPDPHNRSVPAPESDPHRPPSTETGAAAKQEGGDPHPSQPSIHLT